MKKTEKGSDVHERLPNLIPLPEAYGFIMWNIKLIEGIIQIHLWLHQLAHLIESV